MLRRSSFSAALAALAVPVLLAGPGHADDVGTPNDDPGAQAELRKEQQVAPPRKQVVSRRAKQVRADTVAPLAMTIDQLTPSTIPERGMVRVSGTITNNDTVAWSTINVYAFVSEDPLTTADQLDKAAATPEDAVVGVRITDEQYKYNIAELAPGDQATYSLSIPRRLLQADTPGVYWFGVHALGEGPEGRDLAADGRARTFLPMVPEARSGQQPTAVVIPLRHRLVYTNEGSLDDLSSWTQSLSQGGRLRSLVDFGANSGDRTVTWLVDPALIDAVRRLADGNPPRSLAANLEAGQDDGEDGASEDSSASTTPTEQPTETPTAEPENAGGSPLDLDELDPVVQAAAQAAQAWLARLGDAMRPEDQVMSLPYGDVDVSAAAVHNPKLYERAVARAGTTLPGFDVTTTPVLSSPSGYLTAQAIRGAVPGSTILLTDAMFDDPASAPAVADTEGQHAVVTSTAAGEGGPGPGSQTSITAMRQRLLSEAAVRFLRGGRAPLTLVVPHDWNPSDGSSAFFSGLDASWLDLTSVRAVSQAATPTSVDGATLRYPKWQEVAELDQPNFDSADELIRSGVALQNLLTLNNVVSGSVTDQALGTVSYYARTRPIENRASADASRVWIENRLGRVRVEVPGRAVTLSSSSGRFQATVTNDLDQPVTVTIGARADDRLTIDSPARIEVAANSRVSVLLTARTDENGIHQVTLVVTDKRGTPLGATTALTIRSAQVSNVIWLFLGIGCALLFGAIGVRLFRRVRNARRAPQEAGASDAAGGGAEPTDQKEPAGAATR